MSSTPTEEQIVKVKTNLTNMIAWNQQLQVQGNTKILNAYALLSLSDNKDLGLQVGINLLCGGINAVGSLLGPIGAGIGQFLEWRRRQLRDIDPSVAQRRFVQPASSLPGDVGTASEHPRGSAR